ncbi:MAG: metal ABC transporter substrate-binding protein [Pseudomonadota bacterium]
MLSSRRAFCAACAAAAALSGVRPVAAAEKPRIVAVTYALAYFAERLAGDAAEVAFPVPAGRDPALWRPQISDISAIQSADLILLNGAGFAGWTTKASLPRGRLVDTSRAFADRYIKTKSITHSHGADGEHTHEGVAAFTWLDQTLAAQQAEAVAAGLNRAKIGAPEAIDAALQRLKATLAALDAEAGALAAAASGAAAIATHPRYQYFARAYGLEIASLDWEAGAAPSAAQLQALSALIAATGARVLIWEAAPPAAAREAVRALGVRDAVFPTLAAAPASGDYETTLRNAVAELRAAFDRAKAG